MGGGRVVREHLICKAPTGALPSYHQQRAERRSLTPTNERRGRPRLPLRCSLRLYREGTDHPIHGETLNISSEGFYLVMDARFAPGDTLTCMLDVPSEATHYADAMKLRYEVKVLRVDSVGRKFGVAFQVLNFNLIQAASDGA
jgi:PilZ domain